jgi:aryl-alcohol dehydrogenase-like predicted oxidoreductase
MLPIPGTTSVEHLEQNVRAAQVQLTDEEFDQLTGAIYPVVTRPTGRSTS